GRGRTSGARSGRNSGSRRSACGLRRRRRSRRGASPARSTDRFFSPPLLGEREAEIGLHQQACVRRKGDTIMRFLCIAKSDERTEAGIPPDKELFATMGQFVEEQMKSGVLLATEGINPSSKAASIRLSRGKLTCHDAPAGG